MPPTMKLTPRGGNATPRGGQKALPPPVAQEAPPLGLSPIDHLAAAVDPLAGATNAMLNPLAGATDALAVDPLAGAIDATAVDPLAGAVDDTAELNGKPSDGDQFRKRRLSVSTKAMTDGAEATQAAFAAEFRYAFHPPPCLSFPPATLCCTDQRVCVCVARRVRVAGTGAFPWRKQECRQVKKAGRASQHQLIT